MKLGDFVGMTVFGRFPSVSTWSVAGPSAKVPEFALTVDAGVEDGVKIVFVFFFSRDRAGFKEDAGRTKLGIGGPISF